MADERALVPGLALLPDPIGGFSVDSQRVVDKQLGGGRDVGERMNEDTITRLNGFAIRCACVVQEPCMFAFASPKRPTRSWSPAE